MSAQAYREATERRQRLFAPVNAVVDHPLEMRNGRPIEPGRETPAVVPLFHVCQQVIPKPIVSEETHFLQANRHLRWPSNTQRAFVEAQYGALLPGLTIKKIKLVVAQHYGISIREMDGRSRHAHTALVRQIAIYLTKKLMERSLPEIGRHFGPRDHTTCLHAIKKVGAMREKDPEFNETISYLEIRLAPYEA
jgi:hypothetical protein